MEQERLQQAFLNIVRNAVEAMHGQGTIRLKPAPCFKLPFTVNGIVWPPKFALLMMARGYRKVFVTPCFIPWSPAKRVALG